MKPKMIFKLSIDLAMAALLLGLHWINLHFLNMKKELIGKDYDSGCQGNTKVTEC
jgi:hypothetical protein